VIGTLAVDGWAVIFGTARRWSLLDTERNQARSKPDPVDRPVRTARTTVHHYTDTHYCWAHRQFCWHSPFCIPTSHLRCGLMEVRDHDDMGELVPKTWVSWYQITTSVSWYQKHGWAGTELHFWIFNGWLLALSNSLVSLYDHLPACSSHKDKTKTTQHPIRTFYAGRPSNLPGLGPAHSMLDFIPVLTLWLQHMLNNNYM